MTTPTDTQNTPKEATLIWRALRALHPWNKRDYPGFMRGSRALLGVTEASICGWRSGRRRPSVANLQRVLGALLARVAADKALLAELDAELAARALEPPQWRGLIPVRRKAKPAAPPSWGAP